MLVLWFGCSSDLGLSSEMCTWKLSETTTPTPSLQWKEVWFRGFSKKVLGMLGHTIMSHMWPLEARLDDVLIHMLSIWVQMHGLTRGQMTLENTRCIGALAEELLEADDPNDPFCWRGFQRSHVRLDSRQPLVLGWTIQEGSMDPKWIEFRILRPVEAQASSGGGKLSYSKERKEELGFSLWDTRILRGYISRWGASSFEPESSPKWRGKEFWQAERPRKKQGPRQIWERSGMKSFDSGSIWGLYISNAERSGFEIDCFNPSRTSGGATNYV
ncbi:hypothetical protein ACLB2K_065498 [Fragaria x ananassa]